MGRIAMPDIRALSDPLLGTAYEEMDCWDLVRHLYHEGFGLDLARDTERAAVAFQEVWRRGSSVEPMTIVQPWDLVIILNNEALPISEHVGVAVDHQSFIHSRLSETGVALGRLRVWQSRVLQLARYRELL